MAVWDEDEDINDTKGYLEKILASGHGLELSPNLEVFLNSKNPGWNLNPKSAEKIKQAYEWATGVEPIKIPHEFDCVKQFLCPQAAETFDK
jgi:hypothetical protein